jgi:hypothetical protein
MLGVAAIGSLILGYYAGAVVFPLGTADLTLYFTYFLSVPILLSLIGVLIGRRAKNQVEYTSPELEFTTVQLNILDAQRLLDEYPKKYARLGSFGQYWLFYYPFVMIITMLILPTLVDLFESVTILLAVPIYGVLFLFQTTFGYELGLRASQNAASADFTLPPIREAIWLARRQSTTPGISSTRVVLDKAQVDEYEIYRYPRVVNRINGIEEEAYIEGWSEELGSVYRVHCRLYGKENGRDISWWWMSRDRNFRKYAEEDPDDFYYVRQPVLATVIGPGVKDVKFVTENAVAIVILEYLGSRGENEGLRSILTELGVE